MSKSSLIALVDCNSFYCSCEKVFRPQLNNRPVIVLSNNDGCVVSRSDEAKALGIGMAVPFFEIRDLVKRHQVAVFSSNYTLYGDMSARVMQALTEFTPYLQIYSIDEAFLSFDGLPAKDILPYALEIKNKIFQYTGIPICVGVGKSKVLAKVANRIAKKNKDQTQGVFSLHEPEVYEKSLREFPVEDIWGIGRASAAKLRNNHIINAQQLRDADPQRVQKILGIHGKRIGQELKGQSCINLDNIDSDKKQIMSTRSFGKPVYALTDLKESLANHVTSACEKLRRSQLLAHTVSVFIRTSPFRKHLENYYNQTASFTFSVGTSNTSLIIKQVHTLAEQIYKKNCAYKKCGIILSQLTKADLQQLNFFNPGDTLKDQRLMQAMDSINAKIGKDTLKFASCGSNPFWRMLSEMKSPCYTTKWSDLLQVK